MKSKLIDVHWGSTSESWLVVYEDGRIAFHQENDGAKFLRHGAEAVDEWITLADVGALDRQHYDKRLVEQVRAALAEFGQQ
jgi:hypothetical protein